MTNANAICFIACVNNDELYSICLDHIRSLRVPLGFKVETIDIREAENMAAAYNAAMQATNAKYKVYLHQDTFIINQNFILDLISLFNEDQQLGLIGVIGSEDIPKSGVWWESSRLIGKVMEYRSTYRYLNFNQIDGPINEVKALDGVLLATQFDVLWREDVFDGWHFYDISQCYEFSKLNYKIGIPFQQDPWVLHSCGSEINMNGYTHYLSKFLQEYRVLG